MELSEPAAHVGERRGGDTQAQAFSSLPIRLQTTKADGSPGLDTSITVAQIDGRTTVRFHLTGDLCDVSVPPLCVVADGFVAHGAAELRFELDDLRMCSSAGLAFWVDLRRRFAERGGAVRLVGGTALVRRTLRVAGLEVEPALRA